MDVSVSGQKALAMASEDGAVMTDAVSRCEAFTWGQGTTEWESDRELNGPVRDAQSGPKRDLSLNHVR